MREGQTTDNITNIIHKSNDLGAMLDLNRNKIRRTHSKMFSGPFQCYCKCRNIMFVSGTIWDPALSCAR